MHRPLLLASLAALVLVSPLGALRADALRGSLRSMVKQHEVAVRKDLEFVGTRGELERLVAAGELVAIEGNADYVVDGQAPYRYGRPEIRLFLERLGAQYHAATGRRLVVTSLVRPSSEQPSNAHRLSVHPAGMAIDFRVPADARERRWLETALLGLESKGVLDVTRERRPPHYHVAVYPAEYAAYAAGRGATGTVVTASLDSVAPAASPNADSSAAAALLALADAPVAVDASDRRAPDGARVPVALAGLVFGVGMVGVVRRRRGERRRTPREGEDRRRA